MATATYPAATAPGAAMARLHADGTALVQAGSQDIGTGTYTIMTQIAADALGLPLERVRFELGDTQLARDAGVGRLADRVQHRLGGEARGLARRGSSSQLAVADAQSPLHGLRPEQVDVAGGGLRSISEARPASGETYARAC